MLQLHRWFVLKCYRFFTCFSFAYRVLISLPDMWNMKRMPLLLDYCSQNLSCTAVLYTTVCNLFLLNFHLSFCHTVHSGSVQVRKQYIVMCCSIINEGEVFNIVCSKVLWESLWEILWSIYFSYTCSKQTLVKKKPTQLHWSHFVSVPSPSPMRVLSKRARLWANGPGPEGQESWSQPFPTFCSKPH